MIVRFPTVEFVREFFRFSPLKVSHTLGNPIMVQKPVFFFRVHWNFGSFQIGVHHIIYSWQQNPQWSRGVVSVGCKMLLFLWQWHSTRLNVKTHSLLYHPTKKYSYRGLIYCFGRFFLWKLKVFHIVNRNSEGEWHHFRWKLCKRKTFPSLLHSSKYKIW